ncbi:uncharacterized protein BDR25DRAFT_304166 [Lindgomyces ingoldianus]|uniref:Uncharacterized protein n=1 Tax=Lindgomyces ingoldianus TaxID=673940 RepID=A0ACB6QTC5_9PLEO|nr:uncharacterized protein BDR25DRAFT_304166 [Lindgomyces ingoldianus]KAF2470233.1 hypothetical protein BDR25DRAFT_304166 [Lindgomyces ingoldianus]
MDILAGLKNYVISCRLYILQLCTPERGCLQLLTSNSIPSSKTQTIGQYHYKHPSSGYVMETISNVASSASKMIWGEKNITTTQRNDVVGQEPISGKQGKGTAYEPFDQGNLEILTSTATNTSGSSDLLTSASSEPNMSYNANNAASRAPPRPEHENEKTGVVGGMSDSAKRSDVIPSESQPSSGGVPESGAIPSQKQQGADRPDETPASESVGAVGKKKDESENVLKKRDPNDHSGETMQMHGAQKVPHSQEERRESKVGNPGGQEHGKEERGTGEEWVKTSGLAADGGDFDAIKPGAGREADRLMEERFKKTASDEHQPAPSAGPAAGEKIKVPMGQKIKEKLHIGHKEKS